MSAENDETKKLLREAGRTVSVTGFLDYRKYLGNLYRWVKGRADSYSYITYSIHLGLGKSNASRLIIVGERNLAEKSADKVATSVGLRGYRARYFKQLVAYANARTPQERDELYHKLMVTKSRIEPEKIGPEQIDYYGSWLTPVVREMSTLAGFQGDAHWIQEHLNFPQRLEEVKKSLKILAELGYLDHEPEKDLYRPSPGAPETLRADTLTAIAYHQQMIEQGKESLTRLTGKQREVSGCTARMTREKYERIKAKLTEIIDEVESEEEGGDQEVYQINVQLFPFTKVGK